MTTTKELNSATEFQLNRFVGQIKFYEIHVDILLVIIFTIFTFNYLILQNRLCLETKSD